MKRRLSAAFGLALLSTPASAETFLMTTLEWCPYTCSGLPGGGATTEVIRSALKAAGHDLSVEFLPWIRAIRQAERDPRYGGYYPEYGGSIKGFTLSNPVGSGPLGVAEHLEAPLTFHTAADLAAYRLGTVRGYINTPELDRAIAAGRQLAEENVSDEANLLKLAWKRIDGVVIDGRVMAYLLTQAQSLQGAARLVRFNPVILEEKTLHVACSSSEAGRRMASALEFGLGQIDPPAIQAEYFRRNKITLENLVVRLPPPLSRP